VNLAAAIAQLLDLVREAAQRRQLAPKDLAIRLGVHERTVRRLLAGQTVSPALLDQAAKVLRVSAESPRPLLAASGRSVSTAPVIGWKQAARVIGVPPRTLRRWRARHGVPRSHQPWWADDDACRTWWRSVVEAP
jgi:transcriptional regulator with XRE-family HTH domain